MSSSPTVLSRRRAIVSVVASAAGCVAAPSRAGSERLVLGQSVSLEGPLSDLGRPMHLGAKAHFDSVNAAGGIQGRYIDLVAADDGYDTGRSLRNIERFLSDGKLFALFGCMGTPMIEAALPLIRGTDIPCFAPFTGATSVRPPDLPNVFPVRASFAEEAAHLTAHMATIGYRKLAIVHQDNSYGLEVLNAAERSLRGRALTPAIKAAVDNNASNANAAATHVAASDADAVLIGLAGRPLVEVVRSVRRQARKLPLYSVSALGTPATLRALNEDAYGITVSQVMPSPANVRLGVVRSFRKAWEASAPALEPSYAALEGYVCALAFTETLKKLGLHATRKDFVNGAWGTRRFDLGDFEIGFAHPGRGASRFVELTMVGANGRFLR